MIARRTLLAASAAAAIAPRARAQGATIKLGVLNDMSGPYRDTGGPLSVTCVRQAVQDFGDHGFAVDVVSALPNVPVLTVVAQRLGAAGTEDPGPMASAAELALELLFLTRKLAKQPSDDGNTVSYG